MVADTGNMPTKIFVGNLSDTSKSKELRTLFEKFGKVSECDILKNFGFVHMEEEEDAKAAIAALNGYTFDGNHMNVEMSHGKSQRRGGDREDRGDRGGRGGGGPMRRGPPSRGPPSRGGREPMREPMRRPASRYDPYASRMNGRYPPIPERGYDPYERRLPPPLPSYERRLPPPLPREYTRERDPYGRPPPEYYSRRSPDRYDRLMYYDRLYDLHARRALSARPSSRSSHGAY